MKKEYIRPELNVLSLIVEDNTNNITFQEQKDDIRLSIGGDLLGSLFN